MVELINGGLPPNQINYSGSTIVATETGLLFSFRLAGSCISRQNSLLGGALEYQDRLPVLNRCAHAAYLVRREFRIVWHYHKSCTQNSAYVNG